MNPLTPIGQRLLNDYQHDFPLVARPYAAIASQLGLDEATVLDAYRAGLASGAVSRIGAVIAPRRLGASTLAAMQVPGPRLEEVAARVSARPEVNHNYQREGAPNLWFVVSAADAAGREQVLNAIATECGLPVLTMPLREEYHIDLGFDLSSGDKCASVAADSAPCTLGLIEKQLMAALQNGLTLTPQPFKALGDLAGINEHMAIELIEGWLASGLLKRFGVVVRHHELGFTANAMCVWDVPQDQVDRLGQRLAALSGVTLCYQRERALPHWPYNLYCMIHGKRRAEVEALRACHAAELGLDVFPHAVLFSLRRFKQCGARYAAPATCHD